MGMFDKDKEIGLIMQSHFPERKEFVIWGARIAPDQVSTKLGPATQSILTVSDDARSDHYEVTTLASAVASKVKDAEPTDFPSVVCWMTVESDFGPATVLRFIRPLNTPRDSESRGETPGA